MPAYRTLRPSLLVLGPDLIELLGEVFSCFFDRLGLSTITPLASFSCLESRGGGGGERKKTSRSTRGGSLGLSRVVVEGMHQILILNCPNSPEDSHFYAGAFSLLI